MLQGSSGGPAPEIILTDSKLENARILRLFLDLTCDRPFQNFDDIPCFDVLDLITLAEKYDCESILRTLLLYSKRSDAAADAHFGFYYACRFDDLENAHRLLPLAAELYWTTDRGLGAKSVNGHADGASTLDITNMSLAWQARLPKKYYQALLRATRLRIEADVEWEELADEFKAQVEQQSKLIRMSGVGKAD
jgi:hypothetical protein